MTTQEAYKTLDLAKGLGIDRVEAQFLKLKTEMEEKIASTSNGRLKQVYSTRLDQVEEAYSVLIEYFEVGVKLGNIGQSVVKSQDTVYEMKTPYSKWLLPAAIVVSGILISLTLLFLLRSKEASVEALSEYKEVVIGSQVWMSENLNVDKFRNGDPIPHVETDEEWVKAGENGEPAWCYYNNNPDNGDRYGKLYNWYAVNDSRGLAPEGWKIPSNEDWTRLTDFLGGESVAGMKMKSTEFWADTDEGESGNGTNESGFSGLPGGVRFGSGSFFGIGYGGGWWSSTEGDTGNAWYRPLSYDDGDGDRSYNGKPGGFSVRCLRD
jgi:uncharacterized protein (TIGR02145 family)